MRALVLAGALLTMEAAAQAQGFTVAGRVTDAKTGSPLAHASVTLQPAENAGIEPPADAAGKPFSAEALTGSHGEFRFSAVPAGQYQLSGARRGYLQANFEERGDFYAAVVVGQSEPAATGLRLLLKPLASISGRVLDSSGDPVEVGTLSLYTPALDGTGMVRPAGTASIQQGSATYIFDELAPGTYYLAVSARPWFADTSQPGAGVASPDLDVAYLPTFFNGSATAAAAEPIVVRSGDAAQANFSLQAVHAVHITVPLPSGSGATTLAGPPAFGSAVPLPPGAAFFTPGPDGQGQIMNATLAPGTYSVSENGVLSPLEVTGDKALPSASTAASVPLVGKLAIANGAALPKDLTLRLTPEGTDVFAGFAGRAGGGRRPRGLSQRPIELAPAADGSFRTDAVPPGEYRLSPGGGSNRRYVVTGAAASGAVLSESLTIRVGTDPVTLAATVAGASAAVSGRVVDSNGAPTVGVMVVLVPVDTSALTLYAQEESNNDGTWTLENTPAGEYRALAVRDGWDLAWKKPGVLVPYFAGAMPVTVPESGTVTLAHDLVAQQR